MIDFFKTPAMSNFLNIIGYIVLGIFIITIVFYFISKVLKTDYSDQTGYKNFKSSTLGFTVILIIVLIIGAFVIASYLLRS